MDRLEEFLEVVTEEERLEVVHLLWLYAHASESAQRSATGRLAPFFSGVDTDAARLMALVREISEHLKGVAE